MRRKIGPLTALAVLFCSISGLRAEEAAPPPAVAPPPGPPVESNVVLPALAAGSGPIREVQSAGYTVRLDLSTQMLRLAVPRDESWRDKGEIRENDTVEVLSANTLLRSGKQTLARLAKGQRLVVTARKDAWVGVAAPVQGVGRTGWVQLSEVKFVREQTPIQPTLVGLTGGGGFISAAVLAQKAKQFDDGLYAAVDLAAQRGAGTFAGKAALLRSLAARLSAEQAGTPPQPEQVVLAAAQLGNVGVDLSPALRRSLNGILANFQADSLRSKPIGFYTWSDELSALFRQDRMLQSELQGSDGIESLVRALHADPQARATYEAYLQLVSRLTNPLSQPDLRAELVELDGGTLAAPESDVHFFPPSRNHEADLVMQLYGDKPIPGGFSLIDELLARIRDGRIDLSPKPTSGWYDYQTWALEPLAAPERAAESARLELADTYREHLTELFKGLYALNRETHIKQAEIPYPAAEAAPEPRPKIYIAPEVTVEPLAEHYQRRATGYRFVRTALEETFGGEALGGLHRLTANGPIETDLATELQDMEALFHGAYVVACLQAGLPPNPMVGAEANPGDLDAARRFLHWAINVELDGDVAADCRMMVPVFHDQQRDRTKVWVFLGWSVRGLSIDYARQPTAQVLDGDGAVVEQVGPELIFFGTGAPLASPITAEVYVDRILDRDEFRKHCDLYRTRDAILENL
jgi:hypothetical protein